MKIRIDLGEFCPALARCVVLSEAIGTINPRPPGSHNDLIEVVKRSLARWLAWYTRPQRKFNLSVVRSLDILASSIGNLQTNLQVMDGRLSQLERDNTALASSLQKCMELLAKLESPADSQKNIDLETALASMEGEVSKPQAFSCVWRYDFDELRSAVAAIKRPRNAMEAVNPRFLGWYNDLIEVVKRSLARWLAWYARPQRKFNLSVVRSLDILASSIGNLQTNLQVMDGRLSQLERDNTALASSLQKCMELLAKLESPADSQKNIDLETALASMEGEVSKPQAFSCVWRYDFDELRSAVAAIKGPRNAMEAVNPRFLGWYNDLIKLVKSFNDSVSRSLEEMVRAVGSLSTVMVALDGRLARAEKRSATLAESIQGQLGLLHEQVKALVSLQKTANLQADRAETDWDKRAREISQLYIDTGLGNDRTAYVIGLFGTGRWYVNTLMMQNIGERAKYFRDGIRLPRGPTSMIYSGHATMRYISSGLSSPVIMSRILEAVDSGFADLIFVYRHPLDSLLTNWVFWRTYVRDNRGISGISQVYENTDKLCADLEQNFSEFKAFVEGDPDFFAAKPGTRFLSFPEFIEETELHLQSATLPLRLEDFMIDPFKEFSKIVEVMSVDPDLSRLPIAPPKTKPYRYLAVKEKVPRFKSFIDGLDAETKRRIEKIGYSVSVY